MSAIPRFSNNVLRAKAVANTPKKFGGKKPTINAYPGQSIPGKKRATTIGGGAGAQMSVNKPTMAC